MPKILIIVLLLINKLLDKSLMEMCGIYSGLGPDYGVGWFADDMSNIQKYYPTQGYTMEHCEYYHNH